MKNLSIAIAIILSVFTLGYVPAISANDAATAEVNKQNRSSVNDQITDSVTMFMKYDLDKDGKISGSEAKSSGLSDAFFMKADANNDSHIDQQEFIVAYILCC